MYDFQPLTTEAAALPSPEEKKWLAVEERSWPEFSIGKKVQVGCEALRGQVLLSLYIHKASGGFIYLFLNIKPAVLNGRVTCASEDRRRGL